MEFGSDWGGGWGHKDYDDDRTEEQAEEKSDKPDREKEDKDNYKENEENQYDFFEELKKVFEESEKEEAKEKQRQEAKEELKVELEEEVKEELKEELREDVRKDLKEELEEEVKKELKQELEEQIKKELKTELKGQIKKELEDDLSGEVREEIREKLTNDRAEIKRNLTELTKNFRNSEHCNDAAEMISNNLLKNDYPFQNRDGKEIISALAYLGLVICNERFDKDEYSNLTSVPNEKIKDRVVEFHKYLDDDLIDNLFEKYEFISKKDELSSEIHKLKEKMEKLKDKKRELVKENERLREILIKSKEKIEELTIGNKQIEVKEGDDESNDMQSKNVVEGENTDVARDVLLKNFEIRKLPDDFFYKQGKNFCCKDVDVIKGIYERCGSFSKLQDSLEKIRCKNVPSDKTLLKIIQSSFKSEKDYQRWMKVYSNRRKLVFDGKKKECSRCGNIKSINDFTIRRNKRDNEYFAHECKECESDYMRVREFKNKLELINALGYSKCPKCSIDLKIVLPSVQFHHLEEKAIAWRDIRGKNIHDIIKIMKNEKVEPYCGNCHPEKMSLIYNKYSDFILRKDLLHYSPEEIDILIDIAVQNENDKKHTKNKLKRWIKKRSIGEQVYDGKCIGCERPTNEELYKKAYHHTVPELKKTDFSKFEGSIAEFSERLREEKCVNLCVNCHSLVESPAFYRNIDSILDGDVLEEVKGNYETIVRNIKDFKFPNIDVVDHLEKRFGFRESWESYIIHIARLSEEKPDGMTNTSDLAESLGIRREAVNTYFNRYLKDMDLIQIIKTKPQNVPNKLKLTKKALDILSQNSEYVERYWKILEKLKKIKY